MHLLRGLVGADARIEIYGRVRDRDDDGIPFRARRRAGRSPPTERPAMDIHTSTRRAGRMQRITRPASRFKSARSVKCLHRRQVVDVEPREPLTQRILCGPSAPGRVRAAAAVARRRRSTIGRPPRESSSRSRPLQDLAGARDDRGRQPGEPRDLDAVAAIGTAGDDLAQKHDVVLPFAHGDVEVGDVGQRVREVGQLVIVRREDRLRPRASGSTRDVRRRPTRGSGRRTSPCRGRSRRG